MNFSPSERGALSVNEFCEWVSIGRSTFYKEVKNGHLRIRKIGKRTVVTMPDAMFWLDNLPTA